MTEAELAGHANGFVGYDKAGHFVHYCHCGKWGAHGDGVSLLRGPVRSVVLQRTHTKAASSAPAAAAAPNAAASSATGTGIAVLTEPFVMFELPGAPRAWERPGATVRWTGGHAHIHWYIRTEEENYRKAIAWAAKAAMRGKLPTGKPVTLIVHAFMPIPKSWTTSKKMQARAGTILPTGKPDLDNLGKLVGDSSRA